MTEPGSPPRRDPDQLSKALVDYGDRLYGLALRVTRDPDVAADAVQEAFASALEGAAGFRGEAGIGTWLYRIVYNKSIDLLRRRGRETSWEGDDAAPDGEEQQLAEVPTWSRPPDEILLGQETRQALERALSQLTPLQRAVFVLREMDGLSTDETADGLDLEPGTVRVHLHRARLRLRALLGEHFRGAAA